MLPVSVTVMVSEAQRIISKTKVIVLNIFLSSVFYLNLTSKLKYGQRIMRKIENQLKMIFRQDYTALNDGNQKICSING